MCTLTILPLEDGYLLAMNRDESRRRRPATALARAPGRWPSAFPRDADKGGTWIAANSAGLTLALLNRHPARWERDEDIAYRTRGELILRAIGSVRRASNALDYISSSLAAQDYPPFLLVGADLGSGEFETLESDGSRLRRRSPPREPAIFSSSSWDEPRAERSRSAEFEAFLPKASALAPDNRLLAFHASHRPARGPLSACMHREDARTVSFTQVRANRARVELSYFPDSPCRWSNSTIRRRILTAGGSYADR